MTRNQSAAFGREASLGKALAGRGDPLDERPWGKEVAMQCLRDETGESDGESKPSCRGQGVRAEGRRHHRREPRRPEPGVHARIVGSSPTS